MGKNRENVTQKNNFSFGLGNHGNNVIENVHN